MQNEEWLKAYYGGQAAATGQDFSKIDASKYYSKDSATGAITVNGNKIDTVTTATSGTDIGVAKKDGLDFGLYLVVETSAPDKVTSPVDPFLVSVPMTRIADTTTTNKLTDWIYDVHVYPKNSTATVKSRLKKKAIPAVVLRSRWRVLSSSYRNRMAQIGQTLLQTIAIAAPTI